MQTLYEHSRRILAVFLIAALLCLAIIGPLPDTQSSATLTCTTTGIAAIFLVVVASHADPHFGLDSLAFIVTFLASAVCRRAATIRSPTASTCQSSSPRLPWLLWRWCCALVHL